jgi:hypothetical protein
MVTMLPFRIEAYFDVTDARLTDDQAVDSDVAPKIIGLQAADRGSGRFFNGVLNSVELWLVPTNVVTYQWELYSRENNVWATWDRRSARMFMTWDNHIADVAACAANTRYLWNDLNVPFTLDPDSPGTFLYHLDWSGAPGDTLGMIILTGWREA